MVHELAAAVLFEFVGAPAVTLRVLGDLRLELRLLELHLFALHDLFHDETGLDADLSLHFVFGGELLAGHPHITEIVLEFDALHADAAAELVDHVLDFVVDHDLGDVHFRSVDDALYHRVFVLAVGTVLRLAGEPCLDLRLVVGESVAFGDIFCELVVERGELLLLDRIDLAGEHGLLALELGRAVVLGESHDDILFLARLHADELILETGDEGARAELEIVAFRAAAVKRHAVHRPLEVDIHGVAVLRGSVDIHKARLPLTGVLHRLVDLLRADLVHLARHAETLVRAELDLGTHGHRKHELDAAVFGEIKGFELRPVHGIDVLFGSERLGVRLGYYDIHGVFEKYLSAVHAFDHLHGHMTLAETGHGILVLGLVVGSHDRLIELVLAEKEFEFDAIFLGSVDSVTHLSSEWTAGCLSPPSVYFHK